ncbi:MAG: inorganic phosphate transporter [Acidiphilium sp.]|nr:inorganic phosphate transporter [Acidiphilium sp.]MDD4937327.1 inorganic phosphate transporter [Acidiphilium sp.]
MIAIVVLILTALAFAWSMGAHYTGACMGMPYATKSIGLRPALGMMAVMTLIGAAFLSHRVLTHIGHGIIVGQLAIIPAIIVIGVAFLLTAVFTQLRIPTSTIQILVFALLGSAGPLGLGIEWNAILQLAVLWVLAPVIACGLGFLFTRFLDRLPWINASGSPRMIGQTLVIGGAVASLAMGANDVSNATAVFLSVHFCGPLLAGLIGGAGLAVGILTWGRPLLERVAFDVVKMDMKMATAAQLVQALVVLTAVLFGYFTSMNQALIGAMAGAGLARDRQTIDTRVIIGIVCGWLVGPGAGFALSYSAARAYQAIVSG